MCTGLSRYHYVKHETALFTGALCNALASLIKAYVIAITG